MGGRCWGRGGSALDTAMPSKRLFMATCSLTAALHPGKPGLELGQAENVEGRSQGRWVRDEGH